jgi:arsenate reductase
MTIIVYHNPKCSKSRAVVEYLTEQGKSFETREYLKEPLSEQEIKELTENISPLKELVRESPQSKEYFSRNPYTKEQVVQYLYYNQKDLQRPIVKTEKGYAIGRPLENIFSIL